MRYVCTRIDAHIPCYLKNRARTRRTISTTTRVVVHTRWLCAHVNVVPECETAYAQCVHVFIVFSSSLPPMQVPVKSWFDDTSDTELHDLIPLFEKLSKVESVYSVLSNSNQAATAGGAGAGEANDSGAHNT